MKGNFFSYIAILFLVCLISCKASRSVTATDHAQSSCTGQMEAHKVDSLWASLLEQTYVKIEFYPPVDTLSETNYVCLNNDSAIPADPRPVILQGGAISVTSSPVKSIEIMHEKEIATEQKTIIDSAKSVEVYSENHETIDKETSAGHDYGFLLIMFAVATLLFLVFINIKKKWL